MNARAVKWAVALVLSAVLHAGAAVWFGVNPDEVEVAGGARAGIAVLGNAFQDSLAAGGVSQAVEPTENESEAITPVSAEQAAETPVEPVVPAPSATSDEAVATIQPPAISEAAQAPTVETAKDAPQESLASPDSGEAPSAKAEAVESSAGEVAIAALEPSQQAAKRDEAIAPTKSETVDPVKADVPPMPGTAPKPTPRPAEIAKAEPESKAGRTPEAKPAKKPREKPRQRAGAGGNNQQNARRGSADGSDKARKTEAGVSGHSREAGNAAVSNYPGQVYSKLRRSLRYPAEARRKHVRGEVHVRFTVSRAGGVGSVSVARSSGSPVLDKAALETVRRAAPFPAIPAASGKSSWSFTVPLAFTR